MVLNKSTTKYRFRPVEDRKKHNTSFNKTSMQLNIPHLTDSVKHHCLTIVFLFSLSALAQGQSVDYAYDNAGNRTSRKVVSLAQTAPKKQTEDPAPVVDQLGERTVKVYPMLEAAYCTVLHCCVELV